MEAFVQRRRREGLREAVTILVGSVAACVAGAMGLSMLRGDEGWESTATVRGAPTGEPLRSATTAARALHAAGARGEGPGALLDHLSAARPSRGAVAFTVRADGPAAARRLAAGYARAWADAAVERSRESSDTVAPAAPRPATAKPVRVDRGTPRAALIGAGVGVLVGLLLAFLRERIDVRRTSSRIMAARLGLGVLGRVPEVPEVVEEAYRVAAVESPESAAAEAYELLAARIVRAASDASAGVVAVCGTVAEDRGEHAAAAVAATLAAEGRRVAVAELDPSCPVLRRQFALSRRPGAADVARGDATLDEALAAVPGLKGLAVLTAGAGPAPDPEAADDLVEALRRRFDLVILAARPLLAGGRAALEGVDAVVIAVALRRTRNSRRTPLERVLEDIDTPVLGFVLMASAGDSRPDRVSARRA
jgi:Mrp family chromosome partitioning ATPase